TKINNMKIYTTWVFVLFYLAFINLEYLFSVKYWVLSLKLESLMFRETNLSLRKTAIVNIIIGSLEVILLTSLTLLIVFVYYVVKDEARLYIMRYTGFIGILIDSLAAVVFIGDSFRRLSKCIETDGVGIPRKQILMHVGSLFLSTLSVAAAMVSVIASEQVL
ncbi:MAG: hypothetical protein ACKO96_07600, partial [Flammeovirgaceae bacterium]